MFQRFERWRVISLKLDIDYVFSPPSVPLRFSSEKQWWAEGKESNIYAQTFSNLVWTPHWRKKWQASLGQGVLSSGGTNCSLYTSQTRSNATSVFALWANVPGATVDPSRVPGKQNRAASSLHSCISLPVHVSCREKHALTISLTQHTLFLPMQFNMQNIIMATHTHIQRSLLHGAFPKHTCLKCFLSYFSTKTEIPPVWILLSQLPLQAYGVESGIHWMVRTFHNMCK